MVKNKYLREYYYKMAIRPIIRVLLSILLFQCLQSCEQKGNSALIEGLSSEIIPEPDSIKDKKAINDLVYRIATLERVENAFIGLEGRKSEQPNYVEYLVKWADTGSLVKLTDHPNAIVKSFSFRALQQKNYTGLKDIFEKHLFDKQTYSFHSGCVVTPVAINLDFFNTLSPSLSKKEREFYKAALLKQYAGGYLAWELGLKDN